MGQCITAFSADDEKLRGPVAGSVAQESSLLFPMPML